MPPIAKILTIEDERTIRSGLAAYLEDSGYEVLQAENGDVGLAIFRRDRPDVILCDLRLPGIDGLDILSTVTEESPETPVIVVSGVGQIADAVQALKRGAWDFIAKPIHDMGMLENAIKRVLERGELLQQNRIYRETLESLNRDLVQALKQYEEDQEAGRKMQFQLLPPDNQTFGEYTFTRRLYPSTYLSGDFVDYAPIDAHNLGFYMADVSGHGAASAFVTVMLKTLTAQYRDAYLRDGDMTILQPQQLLQRLDQDVRKQKLDKHLTIFYAVIDTRRQVMRYSSGGQLPYPILFDGTQTRTLVCRGRPVGLFEDSRFQTHEISISQPWVLLLVSDGILDLLTEGTLQEKHEMLCQRLEEANTSLHTLSATLGLETSPRLPDDVALLMVSRSTNNG